MATITIEIPDGEDDILTARKKLRNQLAIVNSHREALWQLLK